MKKILVSILPLFLSSCYVLKPDSSNLTAKDYNDRQEISNPVLVKKRNAIGVSFNIIAPIAAGGAMYQFVNPIVNYQDGAEKKGFQPANAVAGVLGMLALNKLIDYSFGLNKQASQSEKNIQKWIDKVKLDRENNYFSNDNYTSLTIIPKSKESTFEVKSINDVNEFKTLFPEASNDNINNVIKQGAEKLTKPELTQLIKDNPDSAYLNIAVDNYIKQSTTVSETYAAFDLYPTSKLNKEAECFIRVKKPYDALFFNKYFPSSVKLNEAFQIGISQIEIIDYPNYIADFNIVNSDLIESYKKKYVSDCNNLNDCLKRATVYPMLSETAAAKCQNMLNSFDDYEAFIENFSDSPLIENISTEYTNKLKLSYENIAATDDLGFYNFYNELLNADFKMATSYRFSALQKFNDINEQKLNDFNEAKDNNYGSTLVKLIFKMKNGSPAIQISNTIAEYMKQRRVSGFFVKQSNNFDSVESAKTYFSNCVINASWYREGTSKDGSWLVQNSGFPKFKQDIINLLNGYGATIIYCEYLGSMNDDIRKQEEQRAAALQFKQEQCNNCEIDASKSEMPKQVDNFLWPGTSHRAGKIVMKNGDSFAFDYKAGKCTISTGWFSSKEFDNFNLMLIEFLQKCREKYCY